MTSVRFQGEHRKWWTLAAVALGLFMIMLDNTVVNVALPSMQKSLDLEISQLEWIVTGYALTFGAFMLTGGKIADLVGRRRTFVTGLGIFTLSSLACGLADSAVTLIWARVVQGVGAALMNPATLSIIAVAFPPWERGRAIGIWVGVSALALAIGPLVGGVLAEHASWNWIFFINLPIGVMAIVAAFAFIDESRDMSHEQRADVPGLVTSGLGLFALTYGLIEANHYGWGSSRIVGAFVVAGVALSAFVVLERYQRLPMLDLALFRDRMFAGANTVMLLNALAMFGVFFYVSLYMQQVLGFSPVKAGVMFLPMTVMIITVAPRAGHLADRTGPRLLVGVGQLLVAGALLLFARMTAQSSAWDLVPPMMISGAGMAMTITPATAAAMGSVRPDKMGVGSAVLNSARQVGGAIGIALMGAVVAARLPASLAQGQTGPAAFVHGIQGGFHLAAVIALAGSAVGIATLRRGEHVEPAPPCSGGVFLVRSGHFFFRYRDAILPGVLLTLLVFTRPKRPFDSDALDAVLDGLGLLLACAGQALRIGTIGYTHIVRGGKGRRVYAEGLVTRGLFAMSRNPLYLGNLLIYAGLLIVWNNRLVYVVGGPFFVFLYRAIVAAEEEFLHAKLGSTFERYRHDVGRWIPALRRLRRAVAGMSFNWRRVVLTEYGTIAAWTLTVSALLIVQALEFASFADRTVEIMGLVALMVTIISLWTLTRWLKLSRRLRA